MIRFLRHERESIIRVLIFTFVFIIMLRLPVFYTLLYFARSNTPVLAQKSIFSASKYSTMTTSSNKVDSILKYWFGNEEKSVLWQIWFPSKEDQPVVDKQIKENFENDLNDAIEGRLESSEWKTPRGILAKVIILDQFSRVIYRGTGRAFMQDEKALALAREAITGGVDRPPHISNCHRTFLYMPFMHSESLQAQEEGIELQKQIVADLQGLDDQHSINLRNYVSGAVKYSIQHRDMIKQFGRFPYRNKLLNRPNTPEEEKYLSSDNVISFL